MLTARLSPSPSSLLAPNAAGVVVLDFVGFVKRAINWWADCTPHCVRAVQQISVLRKLSCMAMWSKCLAVSGRRRTSGHSLFLGMAVSVGIFGRMRRKAHPGYVKTWTYGGARRLVYLNTAICSLPLSPVARALHIDVCHKRHYAGKKSSI